MNLELIALDIDGTLTNDRKQITPRTMDALMDAQRRGTRLVLASARPSPGLFRPRDQLHMREYGGILMSYNGGRIVSAADNQTLFETHMEIETARSILRLLKALPVTVILDDGARFFVEDRHGYKVEYECMNNAMTCSEVHDLAEFLHFAPVKLLLSANPSEIEAVQKTIADALPPELTVVRTAPFYLEIIPRVINKGQGLRDICRVLGVDIRNTVSFGDSENDIPMLTAAGVGVAMGNAHEAVKRAADLVTASNNDDGIAEALYALR